MTEPAMHEVSKDLTRPREQMDTHQAKYEGALDRFRADTEKFRADTEKFWPTWRNAKATACNG